MGERVKQRVFSTIVAVLLLSAGAMSVAPSRTVASDWWCWDDPVLVIENQVVHILAGVPEDSRGSVRLATVMVIVPEGVDARITADPSPRFPIRSSLIRKGTRPADGSLSVTAVLQVDATGVIPIGLRVGRLESATVTSYGASTGAIQATLQLPAQTNIGVRTGWSR